MPGTPRGICTARVVPPPGRLGPNRWAVQI